MMDCDHVVSFIQLDIPGSARFRYMSSRCFFSCFVLFCFVVVMSVVSPEFLTFQLSSVPTIG